MRGDVILDFLSGYPRRIERVAGLVDCIGEERLVAFEEVVATAVDEEIVVDLLLGRAGTVA
jgi:hypothetical protein